MAELLPVMVLLFIVSMPRLPIPPPPSLIPYIAFVQQVLLRIRLLFRTSVPLFSIPPPVYSAEPFCTTNRSIVAEIPGFTRTPTTSPSPSTVDIPVWTVKREFQPPDRETSLLINRASSPMPVYIPSATRIVPPEEKARLSITVLIVAQGVTGVQQSFVSLPVGATYQAVLRRLKFTDPRPVTDATIVYDPNCAFVVNPGVAAIPFASVKTVAVRVPVLVKIPLGPLSGAVKVTLTVGTGLPWLSNAATRKGTSRACPGKIGCPSPPTIARTTALPGTVYS